MVWGLGFGVWGLGKGTLRAMTKAVAQGPTSTLAGDLQAETLSTKAETLNPEAKPSTLNAKPQGPTSTIASASRPRRPWTSGLWFMVYGLGFRLAGLGH